MGLCVSAERLMFVWFFACELSWSAPAKSASASSAKSAVTHWGCSSFWAIAVAWSVVWLFVRFDSAIVAVKHLELVDEVYHEVAVDGVGACVGAAVGRDCAAHVAASVKNVIDLQGHYCAFAF